MSDRALQLLTAFLLGIALYGLSVVFIAAYEAAAHSWYSTATDSRGARCCGGEDCFALKYEQFTETATEYVVTLTQPIGHYIKPGRYSIPRHEAQPTQGYREGETGFHACIFQGKLRCFFVPASS